MIRILYVGALWNGSTALHRMIALQELGHAVTSVDTTSPNQQTENWLPIRLLRRFGYPPDLARANQHILLHIESSHYDILWIDKGLTITQKTLLGVRSKRPSCRLISYSPDDMLNPRNQSRHYLASIPLYFLHVTTKSYNVSELKSLGARDVLFVAQGYDPHTHRSVSVTAEAEALYGADVGFIGAFEQARYEMMLALAEADVPVTIRGPGWEPYVGKHPKLTIKPGWVLADDYAKAICATKINLCFLRKVNRDLHTTRSIEIPACGGFMLAESTNEHLTLFQEGKEAEFFSNVEELIKKVRYYLSHERKRRSIAAAGCKRVLHSGYSNQERLNTVLDYLFSIASGTTTKSDNKAPGELYAI